MRVLVVNAGSSSLKLRLLDGDELVAARDPAPDDPAALAAALDDLEDVGACGHRIVHGGGRFLDAVRVNDQVRGELEALIDLAPLHQPKSLGALDAVSGALPSVPAVACFDTAFHGSLPRAAATYAVPRLWRNDWGVKRYGFHGLSHAYAARRVAELAGDNDLRVVSCHLGAGVSLAAVRGAHSVDTTMGFTPLEGLVMATRSGSVDPGLVLWLQERVGLNTSEVADALERRSGLVGLAGTPDMREVLARVASGDDDARLALEVYVHRLRAGIAAMTAALGGLDALAFTGGVGENAPAVRAEALEGLGFLGLELDPARDGATAGDREIGRGTGARIFVIEAREDLEIARQVRRVLA